MIRYGTNPIAWANDDDWSIGAGTTLDDILTDAAELGFDGIENGHLLPQTAAALHAALDPRGLAFVSGWHSTNLLTRSVEDETATLAPWLDHLAAMGSSVVIVCECSNTVHGSATPLADRPVLEDARWAAFGAGLTALAEFSAARGIALAYHHHMGTVVQTEAEIDRLMSVMGPAGRLLLDTGHCFYGGGDPARVAEKHMGRVAHIHCKNVREGLARRVIDERLTFLDGVRMGTFTVPGDAEGAVDFMPVLRTAARHGYDGWLVIEAEQDPAKAPPRHYQGLGLGALKRMAREVGLDRSTAAA